MELPLEIYISTSMIKVIKLKKSCHNNLFIVSVAAFCCTYEEYFK